MSENPFDKRKMTDHLRGLFGGVMFHAGREYFEQGRVKNISLSPTASPEKVLIEASVQGKSLYKSSVKFSLRTGQFSHSKCSCPFDWTTCKHSAALGLAFIQDAEKLVGERELSGNHPMETKRIKSGKAAKNPSLRISSNVFVLPEVSVPRKSIPASSVKASRQGSPYYLVLGTRHSLSIDIYRDSREAWNRWPVSPEVALQTETVPLSDEEKSLFTFLSAVRFNDGDTDLKTLFSLLKRSGVPTYLNTKSSKSLLSFDGNPKKIPAKLYATDRFNDRSTETIPQTDLVFKLLEPLYVESETYSFFGHDCLVLVREKTRRVEVHPLSKRLSEIISTITREARDNAYYYAFVHDPSDPYRWETFLSEEDIIGINSLLEDAKTAFALETTDLPELFDVRRYDASDRAISVDYDNAGHELQVRAMIDYGFSKIDVSHTIYKSMQGGSASLKRNHFLDRKDYHIAIDGDIIRYAPIDHAREAALFDVFHSDERFGFTKRLKCVRKGGKSIAAYRKEHWPHVQSLGYRIEYTRNEFAFSEERFLADVRVDMDADNDWLAFDVNCYCGEDRVTLEDLKNYIRNKDEFIRMNDGRMLKVSNSEDLERFVLMLESFHQKETDRFEGRAYHAPELENIFTNSPYYNARFQEGFRSFMKEAQSGKPIETVELPDSIGHTLRSYQKEGVHWMHFLRKYRFAGILADDMGLGKTLQALTLLEMNRKDGQPSLVICPKTLLFNWEQEAVKFFPGIKTLIIEGTPKERAEKISRINEYDLIITSYPSIKKDFPAYEKLGIRFHYCLIDEAQFMKNHKTQNAQTVKRIPADYRIALTGTPLENNVSEIWSIFDFLMPGFLGNYATFVKKFQTPIMKNNDPRALDELRKKVSCFMLRRTKEKVLTELPPKVEQAVSCELEEAQNVLYQEILANVKSNIFKTVKEKGFSKSHIHILAGLTKLRQVCNHPALLLKDQNYELYESAKLKIFEELIDEIVASDRKVLVFSQFTRMLDILKQTLEKKGVSHLYLSGKTKNRKELVDRFNEDPSQKVFLISLKAGGTGLNLTAADNVIIFDPWWNPSVENQAVDRAHRMGQTKSVNVYRLVTRGTIEEKILALQEKKQFLFDNLVDESKDLFKHLTWSDIKELFD